MSAYIYLEGGASGAGSKYLNTRCQEAFHKLLDQMGFTGRKPRLVACGGREAVYEKGKRSFDILGKLSPAILEQHLSV